VLRLIVEREKASEQARESEMRERAQERRERGRERAHESERKRERQSKRKRESIKQIHLVLNEMFILHPIKEKQITFKCQNFPQN